MIGAALASIQALLLFVILRMLQDWYVRPQLSAVPGVAEVAGVGGYSVEYQVEIDPLRLRAYRATIGDVVRAIGASNSSVGGHVLQKPNAEYLVRGIGWLGAGKAGAADFDPQLVLRDLENVVVPLADGKAVRLRDLGQASLAAGPTGAPGRPLNSSRNSRASL